MAAERFVEQLGQFERRGRRVAGQVRRRLRRYAQRSTPGGAVTDQPPAATVPVETEDDLEILSTLDELEAKLREVDEAHAVSDDAMRKVFKGFKMMPLVDVSGDPASAAYQERQFELYRVIAGRPEYVISNERSDFPVDANRPFPYYTGSSETVGEQLMGIGFIVRTMALPTGASVLELGAGWGNTTIELARMGYDMTAVDIDPTFVGLIRDRAEKFSLSVDARCGGFLEVDGIGKTFDAVLFFEAFHHCSDHRALLRKLASVIKPGGRVFFAAEPIAESFPAPWGLRLDGESLWAIRNFGWLELGFQESYFIRTLLQLGWSGRKHVTPATHLGVIFEAQRADGRYEMSTFQLPPDEDATWALPESDGSLKQRYSAARSVLSLEQGRDSSSVVIEGVNPSSRAVRYRVEHGRHSVEGVAQPQSDLSVRVSYDPAAGQLVIEAETWRPSDVFGSADSRDIGIGVRTISLTPGAAAEEAG